MERPSLRKVSRDSTLAWDGQREVDGHRVVHEDEAWEGLFRRRFYALPAKQAVDAILAANPLIEKRWHSGGDWSLDYFGTYLTCKPKGRRKICEITIGQDTLIDGDGMPRRFERGTYRLTKDADFHRLCAIVDEAVGNVLMYPTTTETLPPEQCRRQIYYRLTTKEVAERLAAADPLIDVHSHPETAKKYLTEEQKRYGMADLTHTLWRLDGAVLLIQAGRGKLQTRADYGIAQIRDGDSHWYLQLLDIADSVLKEYEFES